MSDAFLMLVMGGAFTVIVFVLGAVFEHWRANMQQAYTDVREQALIEALANGQAQVTARAWSIPDDEQ